MFMNIKKGHCMKSALIRSFSGPYFPAFGLNMERYPVSLSIQSKCGKIWTRKISNTDAFHAMVLSIHINFKLKYLFTLILTMGILSAQLNNAPFSEKIESIPYNGTLAITGGIKQTSRIKIYHKLELKKLNWTRWMRHLCHYKKLLINKLPFYLQQMKFSIKDLFSKNEQIRRSHLLKKSSIKNFIFCAVQKVKLESKLRSCVFWQKCHFCWGLDQIL